MSTNSQTIMLIPVETTASEIPCLMPKTDVFDQRLHLQVEHEWSSAAAYPMR